MRLGEFERKRQRSEQRQRRAGFGIAFWFLSRKVGIKQCRVHERAKTPTGPWPGGSPHCRCLTRQTYLRASPIGTQKGGCSNGRPESLGNCPCLFYLPMRFR